MAGSSSFVYEGDVIFFYCNEARGYVYSDPPGYEGIADHSLDFLQLYNEHNPGSLFAFVCVFGCIPYVVLNSAV